MIDKKHVTTIDEYISTFPSETRAVLENVRLIIHKAVPAATETISYGIPTFDLNGKHLVFFAGWKHHISLYPIPAGDEVFQQELSHYKRAKGTIQFPLDKPLPYDFVEQIVTLLMRESQKRAIEITTSEQVSAQLVEISASSGWKSELMARMAERIALAMRVDFRRLDLEHED